MLVHRLDVEYWNLRVHCVDFVLNGRDKRVRIVSGPGNDSHLVKRDLRHRDEIAGTQLGTQIAIANIPYDAHNLAHLWFEFAGRDSGSDAFADRVLAGEKFLGERLIDDYYRRRFFAITFIEVAPLYDWNTQRL